MTDPISPELQAGLEELVKRPKTLATVRFEQGERKRAALEDALVLGNGLKDALVLVGMSLSAYHRNRSKYRGWAARWDSARLKGRAAHPRNEEYDPEDSVPHVPASFGEFVAKFFPDRDLPLPHHLLLADALSNIRPREVVLFLVWPGAGKTSVVEDYICRRLALDPDHRFRVVSSKPDHAERMVDFCKRRFTDTDQYPEFIGRFGPFYEKNQERHGKPWGSQRITVWKCSGTERDRSLVASSWDSATLGARIDTLVWDDVNTPENVGETEKIFHRLRSTFFSRGRSIRTIIVGNRIAHHDLYDRMEDAGLITRRVVVPAAGALGADSGYPSVPEWWHDDDLKHEKNGPCCGGLIPFRKCPDNREVLTPREFLEMTKHAVGDDAWSSLYQQYPQSSGLLTFGAALDAEGPGLVLDTSRKYGELVDA